MPRMNRNIRVRGYEVNCDGVVPPSCFARYFEHMRWEAITDGSLKLDRLFRDGSYMVVRAQQIDIARAVGPAQEITVQMWAGHVGRASLRLDHEVRLTSTQDLVAQAAVTGVYVDPSGRPQPLPADLHAAVEPVEPERLPLSISWAPPTNAWTRFTRVTPSDIDLFRHVNHARYIDYVEDM